MIRFLTEHELTRLKRNFNQILSLKILSLDKNINKFYSGELTLDKAVKTYLHLLNGAFFTGVPTDDAEKMMASYIIKYDKELGEFLKKVEPKCHHYDEDSDYYDDMYEQHEEVCCDILDLFSIYLGEFASVYTSTAYELVYNFFDDTNFDDKTRELFFYTRKFFIDNSGGSCDADFWYPEYIKDGPSEDVLPEDDQFYEALKCECMTIAITFNKAYVKNDYLTESLNKTIKDGYDGGLMSSLYFKDNNIFFDVTSNLTGDMDYSTFITLTILLYETKKRCLIYDFGKNDSRVL